MRACYVKIVPESKARSNVNYTPATEMHVALDSTGKDKRSLFRKGLGLCLVPSNH
jgi:hypothetical protein